MCFQLNAQPPVLNAGAIDKQSFCPGSAINIAPAFTIASDPSDTGIEVFSIQISSGYQENFDFLELNLPGNYPSINSNFNTAEGKLTFTPSVGSEILYTVIQAAVRAVVFTTTATTITNEKFFSFTIGDTNYLPLTDHFYEYVADLGITWTDARTAAVAKTYFGRQGYLATLTSLEEANFAGERVGGAGWIGGSDAGTPDVWSWVTGPETGTIFWNGGINGSSPSGQFAFWNRSEPNNFGNRGEDYVHITAPNVGIAGSWNDLTNTGDASGNFQPKGYVVEYGAPGDPPLSIVANTSIYIPTITNFGENEICGTGTVALSATASEGNVVWFDASAGGNLIFTGENFTTPSTLSVTTTYYAAASVNGCITTQRIPVTATIIEKPTITTFTDALICNAGNTTISATPSNGTINWYETETSTTTLSTGYSYDIAVTGNTTFFAEAIFNGCISQNRTAVSVLLENEIPIFDLAQDEYLLCKDAGSIILETSNPLGTYIYEWKKNTEIIAGNLAFIEVDTPGNYTVKGISAAGCESIEKSILVTDSEIATITKEDVLIIDDSENNSIEILSENLGIGDYEFSLDDEFGVYTTNRFFGRIAPGTHILFIRDKNGCGIVSYRFSILEYPKFFTPNGNGTNDIWQIKGYNKDFYKVSDIYIFNRFGALLFTIKDDGLGWDGAYQGKILPSNSYWFKTVLTDINGLKVEKTGSFALIIK